MARKSSTRKPPLDKARDFAEKKEEPEKPEKKSLAPKGDVRMTVNVREDLHIKVRKAVAKRIYDTGERFTAGELIEELIEKYL